MKEIVLEKKTAIIWGVVLGSVIGIAVCTSVWFYTSPDVRNHPLAFLAYWPVACSTRGCVTLASWEEQILLDSGFSAIVGSDPVPARDSLTTAIRRHVVGNAFLRSPVTDTDARRYREEVLHISDIDFLADTSVTSLEEYDELVILPFLQQEALREQYSVETVAELYAQLTNERAVVVLPRNYWWDRESGTVGTP